MIVLNLLGAGAFGLFFWELKGKNERVSDLINKIELQAKQEQTLSSVKALVGDTVTLREKLNRYFVPQESVVSFIEELEGMGRRSGVAVQLDSVEEVAIVADKKSGGLRLMMHFSGSWANVVRYVGLLELLPIEGRLERVTVSSNAEEGGWRGDAVFEALTLRKKETSIN